MREDAFRAFLAGRLGAGTAASYVANLRAVERVLRVDLDDSPLDEEAVVRLREALRSVGVRQARAQDCASALRQYRVFAGGGAPASGAGAPPAAVEPARSAVVTEASVAALMRLYADVLAELRSRGVTRTANGPVGDYAELLFSRAYGWTLSDNSAANHDAEDGSGTRYQIKGRRVVARSGARQLGALRRLPEAGFDVLAAVLFDRDMRVLRAALIPYSVVLDRAARVEHTNSWRFTLSDAVWRLPDVRDATGALRAAASAL